MYHNYIQATTKVDPIETYVTLKKSRLKNYDNTYYLENGQEFEFELFNPNQEPIMVNIDIQSERVTAGGLITRPGERVILDCNPITKKKFLFNIYDVEDSPATKIATALNGIIKISSYKYQEQHQPPVTTYRSNIMSDNSGSWLGYPTATSCSSTASNTVETGRVMEGGSSTQQFNIVTERFEPIPFNTKIITLLPKSKQKITRGDLKTYCTQCGIRKRKSQWEFCPSCGNKF